MIIDPRLVYVAGAVGGVLIIGCGILLYILSSRASDSPLSFSSLIEAFSGKKTYILGTALLVVDQVHDLGWLSDPTTTKVEKILLVLAAFTLKAAQNRAEAGQKTLMAQNRRLIVMSDAGTSKKEEDKS